MSWELVLNWAETSAFRLLTTSSVSLETSCNQMGRGPQFQHGGSGGRTGRRGKCAPGGNQRVGSVTERMSATLKVRVSTRSMDCWLMLLKVCRHHRGILGWPEQEPQRWAPSPAGALPL
jgi:hypothetical protein